MPLSSTRSSTSMRLVWVAARFRAMTAQILVQTALRWHIASLDAKRKNKKNKKKLSRANTSELLCGGLSPSTKKNFVTAPDLPNHSRVLHSRVLALTYDAPPCAEGCYEDDPKSSRICGTLAGLRRCGLHCINCASNANPNDFSACIMPPSSWVTPIQRIVGICA